MNVCAHAPRGPSAPTAAGVATGRASGNMIAIWTLGCKQAALPGSYSESALVWRLPVGTAILRSSPAVPCFGDVSADPLARLPGGNCHSQGAPTPLSGTLDTACGTLGRAVPT